MWQQLSTSEIITVTIGFSSLFLDVQVNWWYWVRKKKLQIFFTESRNDTVLPELCIVLPIYHKLLAESNFQIIVILILSAIN